MAKFQCFILLSLLFNQVLSEKTVLEGDKVRCAAELYPPPNRTSLPVYIIDLDLPPQLRWVEVMQNRKDEIMAMTDVVSQLLTYIFGERIFNFIFNSVPKITTTFPEPYRSELIGLSESSGIPLTVLTLYNVFYEAFSFCTSIIVEDGLGNIYHGRNLDNGALLGWDTSTHSWKITERLRPLAVILKWKKNGKIIYESVNFAGYIGILTAFKKDKFTFSLNKRLSLTGGLSGLFDWIILDDHNQKWVSFLTREVMEFADSYKEAQKMLAKPRLLAPVYFILGGNKSQQGCIITRGRTDFDIVSLASTTEGSGSWYLVQTNYDHWKEPPFYDDRRMPSIQCLNEGTQSNASLRLLYDVLSTRPVLNKGTVYSTFMQVNHGMESWVRTCPDPCWPW